MIHSNEPSKAQVVKDEKTAERVHQTALHSARTVVESWAAGLTHDSAPQGHNTHLAWVREEKVQELLALLEKAGHK